MKFTVNRDHLSNGLAQVLSVVGSKATMPILSNVLIEASGNKEDGKITLRTTNLDLAIQCSIKAEVASVGAVTLPVKRLTGIIRELPQASVEISTTPSHKAKISSGSSTFQVMGIGAEEFPAMGTAANATTFTLTQKNLAEMLNTVSFAESTDETRYILNGVHFEFKDNKLSVVATDGRRLAVTSQDFDTPAGAGAIILPAKSVAELSKLLGTGEKVNVSYDSRSVTFQIGTESDKDGLVGETIVRSKVVEGNYPNWRQVIPRDVTPFQRVKLERELFAQCIHRAALVCSEKSNSVTLKFANNVLEVSASSADFGEAHETMAIAYGGPDVAIAFNPQFVLQPLHALVHDEIFFEVKDDVSPGVIKTNGNFVCVIMPVRLK